MNRILIALVLLFAAAPQPRMARVLYLTQSAGFKHAVLPVSEQRLTEMGVTAKAFETTVSHDAATAITADNLKNFDVVVFFTTGELPMSDTQKAALLDYVRGGKGFVGIHSATDTFYKWPEYGQMIGGYFNDHPWHQEVQVKVEDAKHPATAHLPATFSVNDEIYQFRDWSRSDVHVLLSVDPASVDLTKPNVKRTDKDFALAWTRPFGKGRVFYTALGHEPALWSDERFERHLIGGILWAAGKER
jgi:type 1 glutamine amidotransferase